MNKLYEKQLAKLTAFKDAFDTARDAFFEKNPEIRTFYKKNQKKLPDFSKENNLFDLNSGEDFLDSNNLGKVLKNNELFICEQIVNKIFILEKTYEAIGNVLIDAHEKFEEENETKAKSFAKKILPPQIEITDYDSSAEQQMEMKYETHMDFQQDVMQLTLAQTSYLDTKTSSFNFSHFITHCKENAAESQTSPILAWDTSFKSISNVCDLDPGLRGDLPKELRVLFENKYISERAYRLMQSTGMGPYPLYYLLVFEYKKQLFSCLITPDDWNTSLAKDLHDERKAKTSNSVALYAFESGRFGLMKMDSGNKEPIINIEREDFIKLQVANYLYVGWVAHWAKSSELEKDGSMEFIFETKKGKEEIEVGPLTFADAQKRWIQNWLESLSSPVFEEINRFFGILTENSSTNFFLMLEKQKLEKKTHSDGKQEIKNKIIPPTFGEEKITWDTVYNLWRPDSTLKNAIQSNWKSAQKQNINKRFWTPEELSDWLNVEILVIEKLWSYQDFSRAKKSFTVENVNKMLDRYYL